MACEWMRSGWKRKAEQSVPVPERHQEPAPLSPSLAGSGGGLSPIRVTDEQDGIIPNRGYSSYSQAWLTGDLIYVFVGHADGHPRFFSVQRKTGEVLRLGSLLPYMGGEGWYWDALGRVYLCDGPRLRRVNPFTGQDAIVLDISGAHPGCRLWQAHSSDDGTVHSATVERIVSDGPYERIGTAVTGGENFYPATGALDESALDNKGRFLLIKETFQRDKARTDNRIIDLIGGGDTWVRDEDGAVGHSDCGPEYVVGEDDQIGACVRVDLRRPFGPDNRLVLFSTWGMGHVSVRGGRCLQGNATFLNLVALDGSGVTPLLEHGIVVPPGTPSHELYNYQPNGNLSPCGRVAMWMSNSHGRWDAFVLELPA